MDEAVHILSKVPKEILLNCAEIILKNKKSKLRSNVNTYSPKMSDNQNPKSKRPIIDITGVHDTKAGAFIIKAELENKPLVASSLIAAFDLDHTLIKPKSGNKFPKDNDDWMLLPGVKEKLNELYDSGYKIVIFTNQAGSSFDKHEFAKKVRAIAKLIDIPLQVFGCSEYGYCRKPSVGLWRLLTRNNDDIEIDIENSIFTGDAYSSNKAFSDSDLKFALNLGLKFYKDIKMQDEFFPKPLHPLQPVEYFDKYLEHGEVKLVETQEVIILMGPPASTKSSFAKKFAEMNLNPHGVNTYIIISQDELGTKQRVIRTIEQSLKDGYSVIIDRKNEYIADRKLFIDLANKYDVSVRIVWFDIHKDLALHLSTYREIMEGKHIPSLVFNKYYSKTKGYEEPTEDEGAEVIKQYFKPLDI